MEMFHVASDASLTSGRTESSPCLIKVKFQSFGGRTGQKSGEVVFEGMGEKFPKEDAWLRGLVTVVTK